MTHSGRKRSAFLSTTTVQIDNNTETTCLTTKWHLCNQAAAVGVLTKKQLQSNHRMFELHCNSLTFFFLSHRTFSGLVVVWLHFLECFEGRFQKVTNTRDVFGEVGRKLLSAPGNEDKLWVTSQQPGTKECTKHESKNYVANYLTWEKTQFPLKCYVSVRGT